VAKRGSKTSTSLMERFALQPGDLCRPHGARLSASGCKLPPRLFISDAADGGSL